jgi:hypothetical protein
MSNTPPDIADDNRNYCPVTTNYENTIKKKLLTCINEFIYLTKVDIK